MQTIYNFFSWKPNPSTELEKLVESIVTRNESPSTINNYVANRMRTKFPQSNNRDSMAVINLTTEMQREYQEIIREVNEYGIKTGDLKADNFMTLQNGLTGSGFLKGGSLITQTTGGTLGEALMPILTKATTEKTAQSVVLGLGEFGGTKMAALGGAGTIVLTAIVYCAMLSIKSDRSALFGQIFERIAMCISIGTLQQLLEIKDVVGDQIKSLKEDNKKLTTEIDEIRAHIGLPRRADSFANMIQNNEGVQRRQI